MRRGATKGGERKRGGEEEEKARLFAGDKPTHRTVVFSLPLLDAAFGFSPAQVSGKTFGIKTALPEYFTNVAAPDSPDQSRPIPRDFNMNCLLIATRPRGTIRRYFGLSAAALPTPALSRRPPRGH